MSLPNREALKKLSDMMIDCQYAQQMGIQVFNGQATPEMCASLQKVSDDLIAEVQTWKALIPINKPLE